MSGLPKNLSEPGKQAAVSQAIDLLRRSFLTGLDERICRIETAWVSRGPGPADLKAALSTVSFEAHRISGVAGSLGLSRIGTPASELEALIASMIQGALSQDEMRLLDTRINAFLDLLEQELTDD